MHFSYLYTLRKILFFCFFMQQRTIIMRAVIFDKLIMLLNLPLKLQENF